MTTPYRGADFRSWVGSGPAALSGVVNYDDETGVLRHCSGARIELIPATPYNAEWVRATKAASWRPVEGRSPAADRYIKTVACDENGGFHFTGLPAGSWYVRTTLSWSDSWEYGVWHKNSELIRRVNLKPGANLVTLSDHDRIVEYTQAD